MTINNHLFSEALTLSQFFEVFPLSPTVSKGLGPWVYDYVYDFAKSRFPKPTPTMSPAAYSARFHSAREKMERNLSEFWKQTEEFATFSSLMSLMKQELSLQCSLDFIPPQQETKDDDIFWTPVINLVLSSRSDCWIELMRRNRGVNYEPSEEEIAAVTNQDFIREIARYFQSLPETDCSLLSYKITAMRYKEWFRKVASYEVQMIQDELNYRTQQDT